MHKSYQKLQLADDLVRWRGIHNLKCFEMLGILNGDSLRALNRK